MRRSSDGLCQAWYSRCMVAVSGRVPTAYQGAGAKVGIISDSYNNRNTVPSVTVGPTTYTGAAADIQTGDLPSGGVTVVQDMASGGTDEGRAMLQLVHDLAPDAALGFATAGGTEGTFAANIKALANVYG